MLLKTNNKKVYEICQKFNIDCFFLEKHDENHDDFFLIEGTGDDMNAKSESVLKFMESPTFRMISAVLPK